MLVYQRVIYGAMVRIMALCNLWPHGQSWQRICHHSFYLSMCWHKGSMRLMFCCDWSIGQGQAVTGLRFFIYLTRWSFILETLYFCIATWVTFQARRTSKRSSSDRQATQESPVWCSSRLPLKDLERPISSLSYHGYYQ